MKTPRLKKRIEFTSVARFGKTVPTKTMVVQSCFKEESKGSGPSNNVGVRFGFTASRRVGSAVRRSRARRRLRAVVQNSLQTIPFFSADIVLIARTATVNCPFSTLERDFLYALGKLNLIQTKKETILS